MTTHVVKTVIAAQLFSRLRWVMTNHSFLQICKKKCLCLNLHVKRGVMSQILCCQFALIGQVCRFSKKTGIAATTFIILWTNLCEAWLRPTPRMMLAKNTTHESCWLSIPYLIAATSMQHTVCTVLDDCLRHYSHVSCENI